MLEVSGTAVWFIYNFILCFFTVVNSVYVILFCISLALLMRRVNSVTVENLEKLSDSNYLPPISILVPAHNEEKTIVNSVKSLMNLQYREVDLIVVNDGSTDGTFSLLKKAFSLNLTQPTVFKKMGSQKVIAYYSSKNHPRLTVVDKMNGGKSDSLNAGINICKTPFFLTIDADTIIEEKTLINMIRPVLVDKCSATGTTICVANDCDIENGRLKRVRFPKSILPAIQVIEYMRSFMFSRLGWNILGGSFIISGAYGLFNTGDVVDQGGYAVDTVGEDVELTLRLHRKLLENRKDYKINLVPDPMVWTQVPYEIKSWMHQRERWHRGLIDTMSRHNAMFLNFKHRAIGLISYPFHTFAELLQPFFELLGYFVLAAGLWLGVLSMQESALFFVLTLVFTIMISVFSIIIEEATFKRYGSYSSWFKMIICSILECVGYRQFYLICKFQAFWKYGRGNISWGQIDRRQFAPQGK